METGFIDEMLASVMGEYGSSGIVLLERLFTNSQKKKWEKALSVLLQKVLTVRQVSKQVLTGVDSPS